MTRRFSAILIIAGLLAGGCQPAWVGDSNACPEGDCWTDPAQPGAPNQPGNNPQNPAHDTINNQGQDPTLPDCQQDSDCTPPLVCNLNAGKCVPEEAKNNGPCDPIEGNYCPEGQTCLSGVCMDPPGACVTNDECPAGYICKNGSCTPDNNGQPGCSSSSACPSGQVCINGDCKPQGVCNIPHALDRMQGNWRLDSMLHVRDGLQGFTKGLLSVSTAIKEIVDGKFSIGGIPSAIVSIILPTLQNLIHQFVPPWAMQIIGILAAVDDAIDDTRVISTEHIQPKGNDYYTGWSTWELVEFEFQGIKLSHAPSNVPGLGPIETTPYTAREVCGVFFIDKHEVKNSIGKLYRWAIEGLVTTATCLMDNVPCYNSLNTMFNDLVNCQALGNAMSGASSYPGVGTAVAAACNSAKQTLINQLLQELDNLSLNMTYMSLKAKVDIVNNNTLAQNGRWYGTLGGTLGKGNFEGTFSGFRVP